MFPVHGLEFSYALHELPPGRFGFKRWRWELWHGATLHATGWRSQRADAERTLRTYAAIRAHDFFGLGRPTPETLPAVTGEPLRPGAAVRLQTGAIHYLLVPRGLDTGSSTLTAAAG